MKLYEKNAAELSAMLQKKECSAVELTQDVLERIEEKKWYVDFSDIQMICYKLTESGI